MKEIDKILNSLDEFAGYLVDENVGARYIDALSDLEAAIYKHESDSELLDSEIVKETLAEYAHEAWSGWMKYLFDKSMHNFGAAIIPAWAVKRWSRQMSTKYSELPEKEKESDRKEASSIINLIKQAIKKG